MGVPRSTPCSTYSMALEMGKASSWTALAPDSRMWQPQTEMWSARGMVRLQYLKGIGDQVQRGLDREDASAAGEELLQDVVQDDGAQTVGRDPLLLARHVVGIEEEEGGGVDGEGGADPLHGGP
jgi:hypothetical protein